MTRILTTLGNQPFILMFLVVAAGYALGRVRVKGIGLGATASTLVIALLCSLLAARRGVTFKIPELASTIFFNLFMFSVGMKVGPQFLAGLRRDAKHFVMIGLFIPLAALGLMFVVRAMFDLGPGLTPGIFAGASTATPGLGAAQSALGENAEAVATMSTAFAFAYCISMVLFIVMTKIPDLIGRNTPKAARDYEASLQHGADAPLPGTADEFFGRMLPVAVRTYEVAKPAILNHPLEEIRRAYPMLSIERVHRGDQVLEPRDDLVLQLRDHVALHGEIPRLLTAGPRIGPEVYDSVARDVGRQTVDVVVHHSSVAGHKLSELAAGVGHGLYLNGMFRAGDAIPHGPETIVQKGDVLRVTGSNWRIKKLEKEVGTVIHASISTDIVTLALGVALGALLGMITIPLGSIHLQVGSAVGLLLLGIGLSILRTRNPAFGGPYPEPARQLIEDLGLNIFVAILGLNAGAGVIVAMSQGALAPILVGTLLVGCVPPILAWMLGRRVFKMNDALLMGAVAGGRCNSAGMRAAQETTRSTVPAISYPATFAISNVVFTVFAYMLAMID